MSRALLTATSLIVAVSAAIVPARAQSPALPDLPATIKPIELKPYLAVASHCVRGQRDDRNAGEGPRPRWSVQTGAGGPTLP